MLTVFSAVLPPSLIVFFLLIGYHVFFLDVYVKLSYFKSFNLKRRAIKPPFKVWSYQFPESQTEAEAGGRNFHTLWLQGELSPIHI